MEPRPILSLSGTSPQHLIDDLMVVNTKIRDLLSAFEDATPNARDYRKEDFPEAIRCHNDRMARIQAIRHEVVAILEHVSDEADKRAR